MRLTCVNGNSKLSFPVLCYTLRQDFHPLLHLLKYEGTQVNRFVQESWMDLDGDRIRRKPQYVEQLMFLPLLLETVVTGVFDNMQHRFRAPYVKNDFMQSFRHNLPWLPETQQDFRDLRVIVLWVQTAMVTSSKPHRDQAVIPCQVICVFRALSLEKT